MRKKMKLLATLGSLGVALIMLFFGVYAATTANFIITTSVSFTATKHVKATVIAKDTGAVAVRPNHEDNNHFTVEAKVGGNQEVGVNKDGTPMGTNNGKIQDVEFYGAQLDQTNRFYGYQIIITNLDEQNDLDIDLETPMPTGKGYKIDWYGQTKTTIDKNGGVATITCILEVTDLAGNIVEINKSDMEIGIDLGKESSEIVTPEVDPEEGEEEIEEATPITLNSTIQLNGANAKVTVKKNNVQVGTTVTARNTKLVDLPEVVLSEIGDTVEISLTEVSFVDIDGVSQLILENQPDSIVVDGVETVTVKKAATVTSSNIKTITLTITLNQHSSLNVFDTLNLIGNVYSV